MFHDKHRTRHWTAHRDHGVTVAARPAVSDDDTVEDLLRTLRDERGFAFATLQNHRRSLRPFLAWLAERARPWAGDHTRRCVRVPGESAELDSRNGRVSCAVPAYALSTRCHPWLVSARIR